MNNDPNKLDKGCVPTEETNSSGSNSNRVVIMEAPKAPGEKEDTNSPPEEKRTPPRPSLAQVRDRPALAQARHRPVRRGGGMRSSLKQMAQEIHMPQNLGRWPRTFACCLGILFPLMTLVTISLIVGMLLGKLEMQEEINTNDAFVRTEMAEETYNNDLVRVLKRLPTVCLALLYKNDTIQRLPDLLETSMTNQSHLELYLKLGQAAQNQTTVPGNRTVHQMAEFMARCGEEGSAFREAWSKKFERLFDDGASLSFNYIRCVNRTHPFLFNTIIRPTEQDMHEALPATQTQVYLTSWRKSQQELQQQYLTENKYSKFDALTQSYKHATGKEKCSINVPSAAWFWFTVMSSVGYGNQVPHTVGGRALTYTLGFLSILVFGGALATAGNITTHLVNDAVNRCKRRVPKAVMILFYGTSWAVWMLVISFQAVSFQTKRLDEPFSLNDAYWFAFISTTTVGFGDYFLDPEGLFVSDLLSLWGTFLIGFVLLSSFLTELSQLIGSVLPDLAENLRKDLKYADEINPAQLHSRATRNLNVQLDDDNDEEEDEEETERNTFSHPILKNNSHVSHQVRRERSGSPSPSPKHTTKVTRRPKASTRPNELDALKSVPEGTEDGPPPLTSIPPPRHAPNLERAPTCTPEPEIIEFSEYVDDSEFDDGQIIEEVVVVRPRGFKVHPREVGIGVPHDY